MAFLSEYSAEIAEARSNFTFAPMSIEDFRSGLSRHGTSKQGGLDLWRTVEAKRLPDILLSPLLDLLNLVEQSGELPWPHPLDQVGVAQIPKADDDFRPIALQSLWMSTWYSVRFKQCEMWQQSVFPESLQGGIKGRSTIGAELLHAVLLQEAQSDGREELGLTHDRRKCFNRIKSGLACAILKALGLDPVAVDSFLSRYQSLGRRFRFGGAYSKPMYTTSLVEGCSWSVLSCNALFSLLARKVLRSTSSVRITIYVDDSKLRAPADKYLELEVACEIFRKFDALSGQECHGKKCRGYGTTSASHQLVAKLLPAGGSVVLNPTSLGFLIVTSIKGARALQDKRCKAQVNPLTRLARAPLSKSDRLKVVASSVVPGITYGTLLVLPTHALLMRLHTMILRVVHSEHQPLRERHMVMLFAMQTHRIDPWVAFVYQGMVLLRSFLLSPDSTREMFAQLWDKLSDRKLLPGPITTLREFFRFLRWDMDQGRRWHWRREGDVPIDLRFHTKLFKHELRRSLRFAVMQQVAMREDTAGAHGHHPFMSATIALFKKQSPEVEGVLEPRFQAKGVQRGSLLHGQLLQVISGSTRTGDRLKHAKIWSSDSCTACKQCRETPLHLYTVDGCSSWREHRRLLPSGSSHLPIVTQCLGVGLEPLWVSQRRRYLHALELWSPSSCLPAWPEVVFTDGGCDSQSVEDIAFAGAGVHFRYPSARARPSSDLSLAVPGLDQSSYRGEMYALRCALLMLQYTLQHGTVRPTAPSHRVFVLDCLWVVDAFQLILAGSLGAWEHGDLWLEIKQYVEYIKPFSALGVRWVKAHVDGDTRHGGSWLREDEPGNDKVDALATKALEESRATAVRGSSLMSRYCTLVTSLAQIQLTNVSVINARWEMLRNLHNEAEDGDANDAGAHSRQGHPSLQGPEPRIGRQEALSADHLHLVKQKTPSYEWNQSFASRPNHLGNIKSFSRSESPWHFSDANLTSVVAYFDGLAWSSQDNSVTILEIFVDFFAHTSSIPVNRRRGTCHGGRQACAVKDYVSLFGAMMRALEKFLAGGSRVHPGEYGVLCSGLTPFGIQKQAVTVSRHPVFRRPSAMHAVLAWARLQSSPLDKCNWDLPWHLLRP